MTEETSLDRAPVDAVVMPFAFWCTLAVGTKGTVVLLSRVPKMLDWIIESDLPGDDGWRGLPCDTGLYRCRCETRDILGEPETTVMESVLVDGDLLDTLICGTDVISPTSE